MTRFRIDRSAARAVLSEIERTVKLNAWQRSVSDAEILAGSLHQVIGLIASYADLTAASVPHTSELIERIRAEGFAQKAGS